MYAFGLKLEYLLSDVFFFLSGSEESCRISSSSPPCQIQQGSKRLHTSCCHLCCTAFVYSESRTRFFFRNGSWSLAVIVFVLSGDACSYGALFLWNMGIDNRTRQQTSNTRQGKVNVDLWLCWGKFLLLNRCHPTSQVSFFLTNLFGWQEGVKLSVNPIIIGIHVPPPQPPQHMTGVASMSQFFIDSMNYDKKGLIYLWKYFPI